MDEWRASLTEYRIAWITACCGIALILLVSNWPELFTPAPIPEKAAENRAGDAYMATEQARQIEPEKPSAPTAARQSDEEKPVARHPLSTAADAKKLPDMAGKRPDRPVEERAANPAEPATGYYVQAGAFRDAAAAREVAGRLSRHGWPAIVVPRAGLHAVWAGPRQSRDAIEKLQQEIRGGLNITGFIVQKKPS